MTITPPTDLCDAIVQVGGGGGGVLEQHCSDVMELEFQYTSDHSKKLGDKTLAFHCPLRRT